ncbi:alpha/beta hydrolase [Salibacteraceae bacterium]|nr:alpha/beta hydrolase [Salibacteraceae bacterium]
MRSLLIILSVLTAFTSCQKTDLGGLRETIYVKNNGADMPVYVRGNGASKCFVILVHGGPGGNGLEYSVGKSQKLMEEEMAFAYWDQRGQGMAQGYYTSNEVTVSQMANDLKAVVLTMKAHYGDDSKIFILGHSWGGTLGTKFMIDSNNQQLVSGWIEADGAHDIPKLNIDGVKLFRKVAAEQIAEGNSTNAWTDILDWANDINTNSISVAEGGEINEKAYEAEELLLNDGVLASGDDNSYAPLLSPTNLLTSTITGNLTSGLLDPEVESTSLTDSLYKITIPCLFLWGKYDFVVAPQLGVDAYNLVSSNDKTLVVFQESGHSPMVNEPELFAQEIIDFVEKHK